MLKFKIDKKAYEELDEAKKALYKEDGDGFKLDVEGGDDDLAGLKSHAEKLLQEKKKEAEKRRELEAQLAELELKEKEEREKMMLEKGDYEKVLKEKEAEWEKQKEELAKKAEAAQNQMKQTLLDLEVTKVATELAGERAELIKPHLQNRFDITEKDGQLSVVIKDATGLPNPAMTNEALIEEFKANTLYEPIIRGRNSSGGGAGGGTGGQQGASEWEQYFNPAKKDTYSITKQMELEEKDPNTYKQLRDKFNLDSPLATVQRNSQGII